MKFTYPALATLSLVLAPIVAPSAALAARAPIKVTRFHLGQPIAAGTITVEIAPGSAVVPGPEAQIYIDAVANAMGSAGFTRAANAAPSDYRVILTISRDVTPLPRAPSPLQIGLGGGGGDRGFGVGGGVSFGVGKRQERALVTTQLSVRLMRAATPDVIWEGRATQAVEERGKLLQPGATADKIATALFKGFPGESGRTISVK
ncbi:MAG: DUF4136 domain-containing protein [Sphingomonas sp.]|nr:DUF4136 domain-containing protein [Sphingomonas sp.]